MVEEMKIQLFNEEFFLWNLTNYYVIVFVIHACLKKVTHDHTKQ